MVWVMGAWTGINIGNRDPNVGHSTDANGVIAAVKAHCQRDLSVNLSAAVNAVYMNFQKAGR